MHFLTVALFLVFFGLTLSTSEVEAKKKQKLDDLMWSVSEGMTQQEVFKVMDEGGWKPYDRSFSGDHEAWLYCYNSLIRRNAYTIWFENEVVRALTTTRKTY